MEREQVAIAQLGVEASLSCVGSVFLATWEQRLVEACETPRWRVLRRRRLQAEASLFFELFRAASAEERKQAAASRAVDAPPRPRKPAEPSYLGRV